MKGVAPPKHDLWTCIVTRMLRRLASVFANRVGSAEGFLLLMSVAFDLKLRVETEICVQL